MAAPPLRLLSHCAVDVQRARAEVSAAEKERSRLEAKLGAKEREIGALANKARAGEEARQEEVGHARREAEDAHRRVLGFERRVVQMQHEIKRKVSGAGAWGAQGKALPVVRKQGQPSASMHCVAPSLAEAHHRRLIRWNAPARGGPGIWKWMSRHHVVVVRPTCPAFRSASTSGYRSG